MVDAAERRLGEEMGCLATIHMDPVVHDNGATREADDLRVGEGQLLHPGHKGRRGGLAQQGVNGVLGRAHAGPEDKEGHPPWCGSRVSHDNGATREARERVSALVRLIDPGITIHDFRMVPGPTHTKKLKICFLDGA